MPAITEKHKKILGPLISPFYRSPEKTLETHLRKGEGSNDEFQDYIHDGIDNGYPNPFLQITIEERDENRILEGGKFLEKCYLWVIDEVSIKIILELTPNTERGEEQPTKAYVCHTNITGCKDAFIGGELYFCEDGTIYINFSSDRYGRPESEEKKKMVITAMEHMKYNNIIILKNPFE